MINMFIAGLTAGALVDSIVNNNSLWWNLWLFVLMSSNLYCAFWKKNKKKEIKRDAERFGYYKEPTYSRPPRPGYQGTRTPNNSTADAIKNIKPPSTGSGIK